MSKIPTAEEFRKTFLKERGRATEEEFMVAFAKMHVSEALEAAVNMANTIPEEHYDKRKGEYFYTYSVAPNSILKAYPLDRVL